MAHDVFISYSSQDENIVRAISNALEAEKIRCWYASRDIVPGTDWATSIVEAIQGSKVLLLIFTEFSNASQMVLNEVHTAISLGKPVIPFKLTLNGPTGGMQFFLNSVHWLDAVDQPLEEAIDKLVCRVKPFVFADTSGTSVGGSGEAPENRRDIRDRSNGGNRRSPLQKWIIAILAALLILGAILIWRIGTGNKQGGKAVEVPADTPVETPADVPSAQTWENNRLTEDVLLTDEHTEEADQAIAANASVFGMPLKRADVESITFLDSMRDVPRTAWDVSVEADGSVKAWTVENGNGLYDLYFAGEGGVAAPVDCSGLFQGYIHVKHIDFGKAFHTDATTNMRQMFALCPSLDVLDLGGFVTSAVTDMSDMFCYSAGLKKIIFGSGFDTTRVTDMTSMFFKCEDLEQLDVSGFNTQNCESMHGMFYLCSSLRTLDVSRFDTAKVAYMSATFCGCSGLTSLDVSGFDTANVTTMYYMFNGCSGLTALDVSRFDTSRVEDMSGMFYDCGSLTALDVSGFDTSRVTAMSALFSFCRSVEALDVSGFDTALVTNMSDMFHSCERLTALDVSSFDTSNVTDMYGMFYGCSGLAALDVSGFKTSRVTDMSHMFERCDSLTALDVSGFDTANVTAYDSFMPDRLNANWQELFNH